MRQWPPMFLCPGRCQLGVCIPDRSRALSSLLAGRGGQCSSYPAHRAPTREHLSIPCPSGLGEVVLNLCKRRPRRLALTWLVAGAMFLELLLKSSRSLIEEVVQARRLRAEGCLNQGDRVGPLILVLFPVALVQGHCFPGSLPSCRPAGHLVPLP